MEKTNIIFLFIVIILVIFLGAFSPILTYISLAISLLIALCISLKAKKDNYIVCYGIMLLLSFQNFCIGFGAHIAGNTSSSLSFLTQIPFLTIFTIWFFVRLGKIRENIFKDKSFFWYLMLIICIIFSYFIGHGEIKAILTTIRNILLFYMVYDLGKYYIVSKDSLNKFYLQFMNLMKFLFLVGVIFFVFGYKIYEFFGINEVLIAKGSKVLEGELANRYITNIFSYYFPRLSSLYFEPVNLAYVFAAAFILSIYYDKRRSISRNINIIISILGTALTFGKGGYLIVILSFLISIFLIFNEKVFNRINHKVKNKLLILLIVFITFFSIKIYIGKYTKSYVMPHIMSIKQTFNTIIQKPYGHGLGTGGNAAKIFGSTANNYLATGGESALMSFGYQIGIQGLFCLFLCFCNLSGNFA